MNKAAFIIFFSAGVALMCGWATAREPRKILVAHRGASAYAPEHTLEAYRLALKQGADYVEQDLQITKDGVLVCLHDLTLERTTDVEEVYPNRFRQAPTGGGEERRRWYVSDFTLAEIKRLDAGSWFGPEFAGARVPTFQEAIDAVRGRAGLYPETKAPEVYGARGFSMEKLLIDVLRRNKLDRPGADPQTPVIIQSFSDASLRKLASEWKTKLPLVLLIDEAGRAEWGTPEGLRRARSFASGIGPAKSLVESDPGLVAAAHALGLTVTPYTFRSSGTLGRFPGAAEEMHHFLYDLNVDALFTDNPDLFPRTKR